MNKTNTNIKIIATANGVISRFPVDSRRRRAGAVAGVPPSDCRTMSYWVRENAMITVSSTGTSKTPPEGEEKSLIWTRFMFPWR